jgi:hypothetical protein
MQQRRRAPESQEGKTVDLLFLRHQAIGSGGLRRPEGGEHAPVPFRD